MFIAPLFTPCNKDDLACREHHGHIYRASQRPRLGNAPDGAILAGICPLMPSFHSRGQRTSTPGTLITISLEERTIRLLVRVVTPVVGEPGRWHFVVVCVIDLTKDSGYMH